MKRALFFIVSLSCMMLLSGCCLQHEWIDATCTEPQTCAKCGKTEGEALGHTWVDATCSTPQTCSVCGENEGETLEHTWVEATCSSPKACSVCHTTEGEALPHKPEKWVIGYGTDTQTCKSCGKVVNTRKTPVEDMEKALMKEPVYVSDARLIVQDDNYKYLYPDIMMPTLKNQSGKEIKSVDVYFAAWDKNNLPISIYGQYQFNSDYVVMSTMDSVNMIDGATWNDAGCPLDPKTTGISKIKAIAASYVDYEGNTWKNPWLSHWIDVYGGNKLK